MRFVPLYNVSRIMISAYDRYLFRERCIYECMYVTMLNYLKRKTYDRKRRKKTLKGHSTLEYWNIGFTSMHKGSLPLY